MQNVPMANGAYAGLPYDGERSILRSGSGSFSKRHKAQINIAEMIVLPWACLVLILTAFLFSGSSGMGTAIVVVPSILVCFAAVFTHSRWRMGRNAEVVLGVLCIVAIVLGTCVGFYAQSDSLGDYWRLGKGASYANVLPTELAKSKNDAATIEFTQDTRVDTSKTFGYLDGHSVGGTVYCVAPISTGDPAVTRIQFWAAGTDCCFSRDGFTCGQATDASARGAVALPRGFAKNSGFVNAIQGAEKAYNLQAGDDYLLVKWVNDPIEWRDKQWSHAVMLFCVFGGVYLVISSMIGCALFPQLAQS